MSGIWLESHMTKMTIWKLDIPQLDTLLQIQYEACPAQWGSGIQPFEMRKHFLSAFLRNCFLCWDCGNSDMPPTFDADLLCSSRAGSAIIPKIWKLDHSKSGSFCPDFKWCLTRWRPFVRISNGWASRFQISFESWTICNPTSFRPFKIQNSPNFRSTLDMVTVPENKRTSCSNFVVFVWLLILSFKTFLHPMHFDDQRYLMTNQRVRRFIGLGSNPQLKVTWKIPSYETVRYRPCHWSTFTGEGVNYNLLTTLKVLPALPGV